MVMPLLEGGSLANLIRREYPNGIHDEVALSIILKEVLQALVYFHANNQIHRDVKAANILLSKDGKILLGDYGVCAKLREGLNAKTFAGSPCWMAPEVIESECLGGYNFKVDIWSFGITALELARGKPPYAQHTALKVMMLILENDPPILVREDRFDSSFKQMVNSCLKRDPKQRPSAEQLLHMKFFQKARGIEYIRTHLLHDLPPLNVLVPRSTLKIEEALFSTSSGG